MTPSAQLSRVLDTLPDELAEAIGNNTESTLATHRQETTRELEQARRRLSLPARLVFNMTTGKDHQAGE
ncbi:hypothetical protein EHN06_02300 [Marinobacter sp. NP-4(2019)]|uniref:hypothetical protein n=1 Tax=Marinobacter sp. NP-4(2019) TaxID=2488665 RepID=UPI000FC3EC58|nr:hypothetical protein [Marinobacter sp. NP-4(2019)]AZT82462.1 hypothetical protein EHN06_02300 [Marinobacter sp. NP-4(2019)]